MEYFDIINADGTSAGYSLPRAEAHRGGLWHRTVHVWILNNRGELLLQRRSMSKDVYPGLWDISCAGHLSAGDDALSAAVRELKEELGLHVEKKELEYLFTIPQHYSSPDNAFVDNELTDVFLLCKDIVLVDIAIDPVEVIDVRYVTIGKLRKDVATANPELAPHQLEYGLLFPIVVKKKNKDN